MNAGLLPSAMQYISENSKLLRPGVAPVLFLCGQAWFAGNSLKVTIANLALHAYWATRVTAMLHLVSSVQQGHVVRDDSPKAIFTGVPCRS